MLLEMGVGSRGGARFRDHEGGEGVDHDVADADVARRRSETGGQGRARLDLDGSGEGIDLSDDERAAGQNEGAASGDASQVGGVGAVGVDGQRGGGRNQHPGAGGGVIQSGDGDRRTIDEDVRVRRELGRAVGSGIDDDRGGGGAVGVVGVLDVREGSAGRIVDGVVEADCLAAGVGRRRRIVVDEGAARVGGRVEHSTRCCVESRRDVVIQAQGAGEADVVGVGRAVGIGSDEVVVDREGLAGRVDRVAERDAGEGSEGGVGAVVVEEGVVGADGVAADAGRIDVEIEHGPVERDRARDVDLVVVGSLDGAAADLDQDLGQRHDGGREAEAAGVEYAGQAAAVLAGAEDAALSDVDLTGDGAGAGERSVRHGRRRGRADGAVDFERARIDGGGAAVGVDPAERDRAGAAEDDVGVGGRAGDGSIDDDVARSGEGEGGVRRNVDRGGGRDDERAAGLRRVDRRVAADGHRADRVVAGSAVDGAEAGRAAAGDGDWFAAEIDAAVELQRGAPS